MESKHRQYSSSNDTSINDDYGIYGNSECDPECFSELTEHMCRHHSRFSGKRCYELCMESEYRQRRICNDPKLNDDDDLYSNRNHRYLQQNSSGNGNGHRLTKRIGELTDDLYRNSSKFNGYRSNKLCLEPEYRQWSNSNDPNFNDDDDLYSNRNYRKLQ
jgi:hypothetical protein